MEYPEPVASTAGELPLTDIRNPAPAPRQPRPPQLPALTSIRFMAALYVALFHLVRPFSAWGPLENFMASGFTGVSFFFLLSGFILTYSHAGEPETGPAFRKRFLFARFARIYPVYFLTTILSAFLLHEQLTSNPIHVLALIADFFLLQTWSIRMVPFFNNPAWSVSMEFFFYLVFPFVFMRLMPKSRAIAICGIFAFWVLAMLVPLCALFRYPEGFNALVSNKFFFWIHRFPPLAVPEFLCGVMLGWLHVRFPPTRRQTAWLGAAGVIFLLAVLYVSNYLPELMLHNGLLLPLEALVVLGLTQANPLARAMSWKPLVLLGEASYAFYLLHFMLGDWMNSHFGMPQDLHTLPLKLALILALSVATFLWIERPSRRLLLQWWNRRHAVA